MRDVLLVFGMQASGKGTQGERIRERYGKFTEIVVGLLLREIAKKDPKIQAYYDTGKLFPDNMVEEVIENKINNLPEGERILFDGFPRSESQLKMFERLAEKNNFNILAVNILINENEALERLSKRYVCPKCEFIAIGEGKCPKCGIEMQIRSDDQDVDVIKKRIAIFKKDTQPIIDHFKGQGKLIEIDGLGTLDEVSDRVFSALDKHYLTKVEK